MSRRGRLQTIPLLLLLAVQHGSGFGVSVVKSSETLAGQSSKHECRRGFLGDALHLAGAVVVGAGSPAIAYAADSYKSCLADCLKECYLIADPKISPKVRMR
jgi:hypothetical protein